MCSGPRHKLSAVVKSVRPKRPIHGCQGHLAADLTACVTADTSVKQRSDHKQTPSSNGCGLLLWLLDWGVSRTRTKGGCKSPPLPRPEFQRGEFSQVQVPGAPRRTGAGGGRGEGAPGCQAASAPAGPAEGPGRGWIPVWAGKRRASTFPSTHPAAREPCPPHPRTATPARRPGQRLQSSWRRSSSPPCCLLPTGRPQPLPSASNVRSLAQIPPCLCHGCSPRTGMNLCASDWSGGLSKVQASRSLQILLRLPLLFF